MSCIWSCLNAAVVLNGAASSGRRRGWKKRLQLSPSCWLLFPLDQPLISPPPHPPQPIYPCSPALAHLDAHRGLLRWHIHYNLLMLRMISHAADLHWQRTGRPPRTRLPADTQPRGDLDLKVRPVVTNNCAVGVEYAVVYGWLSAEPGACRLRSHQRPS